MLSMFYTIAKKCYNVWVPQLGYHPNYIHELFFFLERQRNHVDVLHSQSLPKQNIITKFDFHNKMYAILYGKS